MPTEYPVSWGHTILEPTRGHIRETHFSAVGMAICGALLIDDLDPTLTTGEFDKCSECLRLLDT